MSSENIDPAQNPNAWLLRDLHQKQQEVAVAQAQLRSGDAPSAERLAAALARLSGALSDEPHEFDRTIEKLNDLSRDHPGNSAIGLSFAASQNHFFEHSRDRLSVERKLGRLKEILERYPEDSTIASAAVGGLSNTVLGLSRENQHSDLGDTAGLLLEAVVARWGDGAVPSMAMSLALHLQSRLRSVKSADERADLVEKIRVLATMHPGNRSIADIHSLTMSKPRGGCYVATAVYGSYDCPEVWVLRRFRDERLAASRPGRLAISIYYGLSPRLVQRFGAHSWFGALARTALDWLVYRLRASGVEDTWYSDSTSVTSRRAAG